jgi:hypothetical protein
MKKVYLIILLLIETFVSKAQFPDVSINGSSTWMYYYVCPGMTMNLVATTSGGNPPYTCVWFGEGSNDTLSSTFTLSNVGPGMYTIRLIKNGVIQGDADAFIFEDDSIIVSLSPTVYSSGKNISEYGGHDGFVNASVTGGFTPYLYSWSNGDSTANIDSVTAGMYTLTVTDGQGCHGVKSVTLTQPPQPLTITSVTSPLQNGYNVSCNGCKDGEINLSVAGGSPPYKYQWDDGKFYEDIEVLPAREYKLVVSDANGVEKTASITLTEPLKLIITLTPQTYTVNGSIFNLSCSNCSNGEITATVTGGVSPYTYLWSTGQTTSAISNLSPFDYGLVVTDANGAKCKESIFLKAPNPNDWAMSGNANTDSSTQFIGTTDNKPVILKTNNIERLRINKSGLISMPNLSQFDTLRAGRITSNDSLIHFGDSSMVINTMYNQIYSDGKGRLGIGIGGSNIVHTIISPAPVTRTFCTANGIGRNSLAIGNYVIANAENSIVIGSGNPGSVSASPYLLANTVPNSLSIGFNSSVATLFVLKAAVQGGYGTVGIATDRVPTGYSLAVGGKIITEEVEVKIKSNWPDYVFSKTYDKLSLKELKSYIDKHEHLPGLASKAEIEEKGSLPVGEMQIKLLEKIEELTLYIIEQNEKITGVEKQNLLLNSKMENLLNSKIK